MSEGGLERVEDAGGAATVAGAPPMVARFTPRAFTQLLWGYRPLSWIARQDAQRIPEPLRPLLAALFPTGNAWIAGKMTFIPAAYPRVSAWSLLLFCSQGSSLDSFPPMASC